MAYTNKGSKTGFSVQGFDLAHYQRTEAYTKAVDRLYNQAISEFARMATRVNIDPDKPFSFDAYPSTKATAAKISNGLAAKMKVFIQSGAAEQWLYASKKGDAFLASIMDTSKVSKKTLSKYQDRNLDALSTFQNRKVNGMGLSDRIWQQSEQFKKTMELGIDVGLGEGKSAQQLSQDLRQNLLDPDRLFRRVRDKNGALQLSQAAKDFHPGQGTYRSSYKNAMRLTRSEINMAYRESDNSRFGKLNFVVGFEVKLSNNHTINGKPFTDICDSLAGKYPKDFVYKGWHPQCRCFSVPILQDPDEFDTDELNELKAALNGTEYTKYVSKNTVTGLPDNFKNWMAGNQAKVDGYKSTPYFIKDNFKNGKIADGLRFDKAPVPKVAPVPTKAPVLPTVPSAPVKFVPAKSIDEAKAWAGEHLGIVEDTSKLSLEARNLVNEEVFKLKQKFKLPEFTKFGEYLENPNAIAMATPESMNFTAKFNDLKKLTETLASDSKSGWTTKYGGNPRAIANHEFGHILTVKDITGTNIDYAFRSEMRKVFDSYTQEMKRLKKQKIDVMLSPNFVSRYGATNPHEFYAEAFSDYLNNPNPGKYSKQVYDIIFKKHGIK